MDDGGRPIRWLGSVGRKIPEEFREIVGDTLLVVLILLLAGLVEAVRSWMVGTTWGREIAENGWIHAILLLSLLFMFCVYLIRIVSSILRLARSKRWEWQAEKQSHDHPDPDQSAVAVESETHASPRDGSSSESTPGDRSAQRAESEVAVDPEVVSAIMGAIRALSVMAADRAAEASACDAWSQVARRLGLNQKQTAGESTPEALEVLVRSRLEEHPDYAAELLRLLDSSRVPDVQQRVGWIVADKVVVAHDIDQVNM